MAPMTPNEFRDEASGGGVVSTPNPTHIIADAIEDHDGSPITSDEYAAHVVSKLKDAGYSIVQLPEPYPDDTVHPYWVVEDCSGPQMVRTTESDGSVEGDWVSIEFTARWRTVDRETAQALGAALLAAARAAGAQQ